MNQRLSIPSIAKACGVERQQRYHIYIKIYKTTEIPSKNTKVADIRQDLLIVLVHNILLSVHMQKILVQNWIGVILYIIYLTEVVGEHIFANIADASNWAGYCATAVWPTFLGYYNSWDRSKTATRQVLHCGYLSRRVSRQSLKVAHVPAADSVGKYPAPRMHLWSFLEPTIIKSTSRRRSACNFFSFDTLELQWAQLHPLYTQ